YSGPIHRPRMGTSRWAPACAASTTTPQTRPCRKKSEAIASGTWKGAAKRTGCPPALASPLSIMVRRSSIAAPPEVRYGSSMDSTLHKTQAIENMFMRLAPKNDAVLDLKKLQQHGLEPRLINMKEMECVSRCVIFRSWVVFGSSAF